MTAQELKNSILQLAVQGKLVPQCKDDEPASELLKRIEQEKSTLIKAGKINKYKAFAKLTADDYPFDIPESWVWIKLGDVCQLHDGVKRSGEKYPYLEAKYLRGKIDATMLNEGKFVKKGTRLILVDGENSGEVFNATEDGYMGSTFKVLYFPQQFFEGYVLYFLLFKKEAFRHNKTGSAIPHLNKELFFNMPFPIPPLAEQKRIVEKIEELMPLIEEYGKAEEQLSKLNAEFPDKLRKSILQQAVQGKLTERAPADEPASGLLKRIKVEKEALIKAGKIKKEKPLPAITDDEKPFDIPDTWEWVRLSDVAEVSRGRSKHRPRNDKILYENGKIPLIQTGDVARANNVIFDCSAYYNETGLAQSRLWKRDTLCLTIAANIADVAILGIDACFPDSVVGINGYAPITSNKYFMYMLEAFQVILDSKATKSAQKNLSVDTILSVAYPLPPLGEQKRIVKRVEELLALCDELK